MSSRPGWISNRFPPARREEARRHLALPVEVKQVVAARRLTRRMGLEVLLHVWSMTTASGDRAILHLIGDGPERHNLESLAHRLGLDDRVRFEGKFPDDDLPYWYAAARPGPAAPGPPG